jgi:hypothetical protein
LSLTEIKKFIQDGSYIKLKQEEEKLEFLKNIIRTEQDELNLKRIVWKELGVVGEFETYKQYSYSQIDLNILLYDVGILQLITYIKSDELSEDNREKVNNISSSWKNHIKFSPSKDLKINTTAQLFNIEQASMIDKVAFWKEAYGKFEPLKKRWERERMRAQISPEWNFSKKITFEYGTLSIIETPARYRSDKVFDILGTEIILRNARADLDKIVEYTARGFLRKDELNKIRKVIDVRRRYLLMTMQKEKIKKEYWHSKLANLSKLSQK